MKVLCKRLSSAITAVQYRALSSKYWRTQIKHCRIAVCQQSTQQTGFISQVSKGFSCYGCTWVCNTILSKIFMRLQWKASGNRLCWKARDLAIKVHCREETESGQTKVWAQKNVKRWQEVNRVIRQGASAIPVCRHSCLSHILWLRRASTTNLPLNQHGCRRNFPTVKNTFMALCQEQYCIVMSLGFQQIEEPQSRTNWEMAKTERSNAPLAALQHGRFYMLSTWPEQRHEFKWRMETKS